MAITQIGPHDLAITCTQNRLGWWAECECGWISNGKLTERHAIEAHERHKTTALAEGGVS